MKGITLASKGYIAKGFLGKRRVELICPLDIDVEVEIEAYVDIDNELDIKVEVEEPRIDTYIEEC
ncbi:MAG: hypothetical protein JW924_03340 [Fusobacteriaceae bacterium]|nr:hypothetical protein [Fusobacteriaceae bacterium]